MKPIMKKLLMHKLHKTQPDILLSSPVASTEQKLCVSHLDSVIIFFDTIQMVSIQLLEELRSAKVWVEDGNLDWLPI